MPLISPWFDLSELLSRIREARASHAQPARSASRC